MILSIIASLFVCGVFNWQYWRGYKYRRNITRLRNAACYLRDGIPFDKDRLQKLIENTHVEQTGLAELIAWGLGHDLPSFNEIGQQNVKT